MEKRGIDCGTKCAGWGLFGVFFTGNIEEYRARETLRKQYREGGEEVTVGEIVDDSMKTCTVTFSGKGPSWYFAFQRLIL